MEAETKILTRTIVGIETTPVIREQLTALTASVNLPSWFETIDNSPYALEDWLLALAAFDTLLTEHRIDARPVDSMLGYLECCTLTVAETLSLPDFAELARENLDQYGFDATRTASTEPEDGNA